MTCIPLRLPHAGEEPQLPLDGEENDLADLLFALRNSRRGASRLSPQLQAALTAIDITCDCKCSLIVACVLDTEPGCEERRKVGTCGCRPRWLPTCLLDSATPYGCEEWREGHSCACARMWMPRCLVTGCSERRKGRRCECARTPTEICPHLQEKIRQLGDLDPVTANRMADRWAEHLWALLPGTYADRPLASAGVRTDSHEATVDLMAVRETLRLSLWHPDDQRSHLDAPDRLRRQTAGLKKLSNLAQAARKKGQCSA